MTLKAFALAGLVLWAQAADVRAAVVYTLTDQVYGGESAARRATLSLALTISDSAVQRGSLTFQELVSNPRTNFGTGDIADFVNLTWAVGPADTGALTPISGVFTNLQTALTFIDGVPSGTIRLGGETSEFVLSGSSGLFSGTSASDANNCNDTQGGSRCTVSGRLSISSVPEPASFCLLGLAAIAGWLGRRLPETRPRLS